MLLFCKNGQKSVPQDARFLNLIKLPYRRILSLIHNLIRQLSYQTLFLIRREFFKLIKLQFLQIVSSLALIR